VFEALQSTSVPICSSACEVSLKPPSPTQKAAYAFVPVVQDAAGSTQVPETLVNVSGTGSVPSVVGTAETA